MKLVRKLLIMLCFVFAITGTYSTTVDAAKPLDGNITAKDFNTVKLSWKKKSVDGYKIYRADKFKDGFLDYKLIATVKKNKTSYTDKTVKKNKSYYYKIVGYTYKNNKYKEKYIHEESCYIALPTVYASEFYYSPETKTNSISFNIGPDEFGDLCIWWTTLKPDGIEILRKKKGKYVHYKTVSYKKCKKGYKFIDTNVTPGKKYSYKFRSYKKIKGKKIYSPMNESYTVSLYALSDEPMFNVNEVSGTEQEMVVSITNNEKYGTFKLDKYCNLAFIDHVKYDDIELDVIAYSFDNNTWKSDFEICKVKPGETIYLKMKGKSDLKYSLNDIGVIVFAGDYGSNCIYIRYNMVDKTTYAHAFYD